MKQLCKAALNTAFGNNCSILTFDQLTDNSKNSTYKILCTNYKKPLFFKVEKPSIFPSLYKGQIKREVAGLTLCREHSIPVPNIVNVDIACSNPWILEEYLDGKLLSEYQLSEENKIIISDEFEHIYTNISGIESQCYGDTFFGGLIGQFPTWKEAITKTTNLLFNDLANVAPLENSTDIVKDALEKAISNVTSNNKAVLFHQDLQSANLFGKETDDGFVHIGYVIDFGMSSFASIAYSQFVTRKHSEFIMTPMDIKKVYAVSKEELNSYEMLNVEPLVLMNYFKCDGYQDYTLTYINKCKKYLSE